MTLAWTTSVSCCLFRPRKLPPPLDVHLWRAVLPETRFTTANLSCVEVERAKKLVDEFQRNRFIQTRTLVRRVLTTYIPNIESKQLPISIGKYGKPFLPHHQHIHFNIAHTHDRIAVAVCRDVPIGVDIEMATRNIRNVESLAKRFLSNTEFSALSSQANGNVDVLRRNFLKLWTCKEAFVKCKARGIAAGDMSCFDVSIANEDVPRLVASNGSSVDKVGNHSFRSLQENDMYTTVAIAASKFGNIIPIDIGLFRG